MFRWDFAKSAETVFSRWAIKRVCKFLLKKKLADFILGDIDLDQLDVQLSRGTIQLSDLALNVDYINQKLTGGAVVVKEGSISSLSIRIPWKLQNCQIELEELELVLSPFNRCTVQGKCNSSLSSRVDIPQNVQDQIDPGKDREAYVPASVDIHDGVKTIAKDC
ncbi:hypothetical protein HPP92_016966 [Vanilla planifolia]|uniref:Autophagy-related protein 2 n=1 Tax=Vanilla planifolia TaxID=51239 RepID=A0A835UTV9_VANPL|nr:hypothetical protein HPP92_016966 [Vanilla planifolia]